MTNYVKCPDCGNEAPQKDIFKFGRCVFCYEERATRVDKEFEEPIDDVVEAYPCECGCGCRKPVYGNHTYCSACAAGCCGCRKLVYGNHAYCSACAAGCCGEW